MQIGAYRLDRLPVMLTIAGSDNTGGAGIQADVKTCCKHGVYAATVITAVTAQNSNGLVDCLYVGDDLLRAQLETFLKQYRPDAVKIGMLPTASAVRIVADTLREYNVPNIVIDPVLSATSGGSLSGNTGDTIAAAVDLLYPRCSLLTPNIPELCQIAKIANIDGCLCDDSPIRSVAERLIIDVPLNALLLKGGHSDTADSIDVLFEKEGSQCEYKAKRIDSVHTHGTGCALSSAIACGLAHGYSLRQSVADAKEFITDAIIGGKRYPITDASGPLYYF